jgi:hypothetical protein
MTLHEGQRRAVEGEKRSYDHATEAWKQEARASLYTVALAFQEFTTDEIWGDLAARGIPEPRENRAMAGVMSFGKAEKWIYPDPEGRRRKSVRSVHHAFPCLIWHSRISAQGVPVPALLFDPEPFVPASVQLHFDV